MLANICSPFHRIECCFDRLLKVKDFARKLVKGPTNEITLKSDEELILDVITQLWIGTR